MTYYTFPLTPDNVCTETVNFKTIETRFESGDVQTRAHWPRPKRTWQLQWGNATDDEAELLRGFARTHRGNTDFFYFNTMEVIASPCVAPVLGIYRIGALSVRTVYVKYSWGDSTNETKPSASRGITVPASYVVQVTVPYFPAGVTRAYVYCSSNAVAYYQQSQLLTVSGGTWQEIETGWETGGATPKTTNGLTEVALVHLSENSVSITKNFINSYNMTVEFEEVWLLS